MRTLELRAQSVIKEFNRPVKVALAKGAGISRRKVGTREFVDHVISNLGQGESILF